MPSEDPETRKLQPPPTPSPTVPDNPAPQGAERVIGGRYRLTGRLGSGGMGTVWRAVDEVIGRTVAIKEPRPPEYLSDTEREAAYERMRREAKAAAGISHPNVVNVFDVMLENGRPWIVMELVPGRTLADELTEGTLTPERAAEIGLAVLEALGAAHRAGILHRDVKPANVLLDPDGRVILTDFGIARIEGEQPLTQSNAVVGSPEYIAPERVNGQAPGPASDLWSLGVLLYEAVEGWSPFRRGTSLTTMLAVRDDDPQTPRRAGPLTKLIAGLLKKDPAKRPDFAEARRILRATAPDFPLPDDDDTPPPVPWWKHRRTQVAGGAVIAVAVALAVLFAVASPFGGDIPDGYRKYEEPKGHLSVAVPSDYHRKLYTDETNYDLDFTEPGGAITVGVTRDRPANGDASDDALTVAHSHMDDIFNAEDPEYQANGFTPHDGYYVNLSNTKVGENYRFHRSRAGTLDFTYQKWDADAQAPAGPVYRHMEMNLVGKDGWHYELDITFPAKGGPAADGEKVYRTVRDHLHIDNL